MIITFSLFWVVIKNNVLYVIRTGDVDGGGLFFPSAINQTFTGLYLLEVCLLGLFFLVRDVNNKVACEAQGILMAVVLVLTISYQIWLNLNFSALYQYAPIRLEVEVGRRQREEEETERLTAPDEKSEPVAEIDKSVGDGAQVVESSRPNTGDSDPPKRPMSIRLHSNKSLRPRATTLEEQKRKDTVAAHQILARLNKPLDESRLAQLEDRLEQVEHRAGHIGHALLPRKHDIEKQMMNDPISKIIMQHHDELEDLDAEERDMLISVAFTHPILREPPPAVWIPSDDLGVSDDEVRRTRAMWPGVGIENRGAYFNKKLKVEVDRPPPDMSEFALIMAEL
jgi:calcium permeable stress-gated cation channel